MNAVGIDVSKGKSTVAIMRPLGEVVAEPFEVSHTDAELRKLAYFDPAQAVVLQHLRRSFADFCPRLWYFNQ